MTGEPDIPSERLYQQIGEVAVIRLFGVPRQLPRFQDWKPPGPIPNGNQHKYIHADLFEKVRAGHCVDGAHINVVVVLNW
jgi:hypothetical protein